MFLDENLRFHFTPLFTQAPTPPFAMIAFHILIPLTPSFCSSARLVSVPSP